MKLYATVPITGIFYKNLYLHLSETIVLVQKPLSPYKQILKQHSCAFEATSSYQIILVYNTQYVVYLCFKIVIIL